MKDYLALTKPRITLLVAVTTLAGYLLAAPGRADARVLAWTLIGTALASAATGCLNQVMEASEDARMGRTRRRPVPSGRVGRRNGLLFGLGLGAAGCGLLAWKVNVPACALAAFTLASYLLVYTPLKKHTPLSTWIGAVPGALPPLIGWAGARGGLDPGAWTLFGIQFFWQLPHFLALSWMYREEYADAGFRLSSVVDPSGASTARQILAASALLLPVSLLPAAAGLVGTAGLLPMGLCGLAFLCLAVRASWSLSDSNARQVFLASLAYLPLALLILIANRPT